MAILAALMIGFMLGGNIGVITVALLATSRWDETNYTESLGMQNRRQQRELTGETERPLLLKEQKPNCPCPRAAEPGCSQ